MDKNAANAGVISAAAGRVTVRVIHTDEELMIAETVYRVLGLGMAGEIGNPDHATKYISRLDPFSERGPHSEAAPVGAIGVLALVQIAVRPISQTRCQPGDNCQQKRNTQK